MKTKVIIALTVAVLFGLSTMVVYSSRSIGESGVAEVKICPNTGLPCSGDGHCSSGSGEPCQGDCCGSDHKSTAGCGGCSGGKCDDDKAEKDDCDSCPNKAAGTCPGKAGKEKGESKE